MLRPDIVRIVLGLSAIRLKLWSKQNIRVLVPILLVVVLLGGTLLVHDYQNRSKIVLACGFRDDKTVSVGSYKISAEVASTPTARQQGLSGRACIKQNEAMLFVFDQPGFYAFWMKDMQFPIDIVWVAADHKTVVALQDVKPSTYPNSFINPQGYPAQFALELPAYESSKLKLVPGTLISF